MSSKLYAIAAHASISWP